MKKYILFTALIVMLGFLTSCADKLFSDPIQQVTEKQIIELSKSNPDVILTPMSGSIEVYPRRQIRNNVWHQCMRVLLINNEYQGNDMVHLNTLPSSWMRRDYEIREYRIQTDEMPDVWWLWMYQFVYKANQFLVLIPDLETVSNPDVLKKLKTFRAIGLTLRAWGYLNLMCVFQDNYMNGGKDKAGVPLYLEPDVPAVGRGQAQDVWNQIMADATEAVRLFNEGGRDPKASISDMDATVANIILARAALTIGDWNAAIAATDAVISVYPTLMKEEDYTTKGFGWMNVDEIIYGFDFDQTVGGTSSFHGWMHSLGDGGYGGSQGNRNAIDSRLYNQIADNDYRKANFLDAPMDHLYAGSEVPTSLPKYTSMKFAAPAHTGVANYNQGEIFIRTSEAILMKAEAQARSGQDAAAKTTLNTLLAARTKEGETPLTCDTYPSMAGMSAFDMVQLQTRIELWGEGFSFFNNKRWNVSVNRTTPTSENHTFLGSGSYAPQPYMTLQIPQGELQYNALITPADQNQ